jgi:hypothetical protein
VKKKTFKPARPIGTLIGDYYVVRRSEPGAFGARYATHRRGFATPQLYEGALFTGAAIYPTREDAERARAQRHDAEHWQVMTEMQARALDLKEGLPLSHGVASSVGSMLKVFHETEANDYGQ